MSFWGENVWRSDKRFPLRTELRPNVAFQPLFIAHYVIGFLLFGKIYRDAKRWRTRVFATLPACWRGGLTLRSADAHQGRD